MRKPLLSRGPLVCLALCFACLFAVTLSGQETQSHTDRASIISDWTTRHVLYPEYGPSDRLLIAQHDPRAGFSELRRERDRRRRPDRPEHPLEKLRRDWSINLGAGGTAAGMYPAKFVLNATAVPSCPNDYVIYPIDTSGSATQANLVAFNNLYSGTGAGGTGFCNRTTPPADDDGVDATVLWSYDVDAIGGAVTASPVISWDTGSASPSASVLGKKVAFVESVAGSPAHFHVLAWKTGDGQDTTDPDGLQNTLKPVQITSFVATDPAAGSGTATDLALGIDPTGTDTLSAPFVDYANDYAYVGNDIGVLYRIKDVFCPSYNTDAGCTAGLAPSLDTSWGVGGSVSVPCGTVLTGAVEDFATGHVFVGCDDGRLYGFTSTGTPLATHSIAVGSGVPPSDGAIVVPPIVDSTNGLVYAVTGTNGTTPTIAQANVSLGAVRRVGLGTAPTTTSENLYAPAFNDAYFSSSTSANWALFSCGFDTSGTLTILYDIGFSSGRVMNNATPGTAAQFQLLNAVDQCSPVTTFVNVLGPPNPPTDWLFLGLEAQSTVYNFNVSVSKGITGAGFPGGFAATATNATVTGGPSGIIVDNENDTLAQASSIYFSNLASASCGAGGSGFCAVKLTQSGLN